MIREREQKAVGVLMESREQRKCREREREQRERAEREQRESRERAEREQRESREKEERGRVKRDQRESRSHPPNNPPSVDDNEVSLAHHNYDNIDPD